MIGQAILDFFRDVVTNWVSGFESLLNGIDAAAAGAAIGAASGQAGHFLALFISPSWWTAITVTWAAWLVVWLATGLVAIIARRNAG